MVGDDRSIQVLNISNVNAQGKTVLNDGKLLELIQKYPFLYNRRVKGYDDSDYEKWAWKNINAAFNLSYGHVQFAAFSTHCLTARWNALKPLIQCLSKAYDMEAIPISLRSSVIKICTELDDKSCGAPAKANIPVQNLLMQNMSAISKLSMDQKLALEREILEVILSSEFESKQATELNDADWKEIYHDTEQFINDIGYKQVILAAVRNQKNRHSNHNQYKKKKPRSLGWVPLSEVKKCVKPCYVRLKRINVEDYLPLAQIIQMNKIINNDIKRTNSDTESPGIFGI